jgi:mannitol-specific phosphotransferase system IIBC component
MSRFNIFSLFKFLLGIVLVQGATVILYIATVKTRVEQNWVIFALLALMVSFFVALWFTSIADRVKRDAVAHAKEDFLRQREKIRVRAEQEKNKVIKQSHQQMMKQTGRVQARASFKVGAALVGLLGFGAIMFFTQFVTVGLLTLSTAGGALVGYGVRARQDYLSRKQKKTHQTLNVPKPIKTIEADPQRPALGGIIRKPT